MLIALPLISTVSSVNASSSAFAIANVKDGDLCRVRGQVTGTVNKQFVCVWAKKTTRAGREIGRRLVWKLKVELPTTTSTSTSSTVSVPPSCAKGGECRVGDIGAGGGVVFYVSSTPQWWGRYMEAAPNRWNGQWGDLPHSSGCYGLSIPDASAVGLGSGRRNTEVIVASCSESNIAARVAYDLVLNGQTDWHLPSRDELNEMFPHRAGIGIQIAEDNQVYASSSFPNATTFWGQLFTDDAKLGNKAGQQFRPQRTSPYNYYVRPIRYGETIAVTTPIPVTATIPVATSIPVATTVVNTRPVISIPRSTDVNTRPVISNLRVSTPIRPGASATVAFTVTSTIGISKDASGIVTFTHDGGGGSFSKIFSEWSNSDCVRASESMLNCEGAVQFSETATAGTYRMNIIGYGNANNAGLNFSQSKALTVSP